MENRKDDFDNAFNQLILNEGGYSNDPVDPGGKTIYGVTSRDYPKEFDDIYYLFTHGQKQLALMRTKSFYKRTFWNPLYEDIPDSSLAFKIFDLSVNRGVKTAVKLLQQTLFFDFGQNLTIDGVFGRGTLEALKSIVNTELFYQKYIERNESSYKKLSTFWKFGKGWLNRLRKRVYV